jgi:hypothetical protein
MSLFLFMVALRPWNDQAQTLFKLFQNPMQALRAIAL